jgi:peptidyl-prolyl cis-trans isomerase SurA
MRFREGFRNIGDILLTKRRALSTLVILIVSSAVGRSGVDAKIIDRIVAVVNGDIITLSELREVTIPYLEKMKSKYSIEYSEEQIWETEKRILDELIDEKLINQEAEKLEIVITEKEVDVAIRDVKENNKLSEDQFAHILVEEGITLEKYREELKNQMKKMRLLEQEIRSKVQVSKGEIEAYYKEHREQFNTPPEVRLQQILLMIPPQSGEQEINQIRERAEGLLTRIRNGEDFDTLAKLYSQDTSATAGGSMGFLKQGELMPELDEAAFKLSVDEVSPIIRTSLGFHIIKVLEKRERNKMTEEARQKEIEGILYNQKVEDKFKEWLKELRKKSYISSSL